MKNITIGRSADNQIVLNDEQCSRRHALLRIYNTGKMEIIDLSKNGTYVHGMRLPQNKPYPIKRNNLVKFANKEKLDWSKVPNPFRWVKWALLSLAAVVAVIIISTVACSHFSSSSSIEELGGGAGSSVSVDKNKAEKESVQNETEENAPKEKSAKDFGIKNPQASKNAQGQKDSSKTKTANEPVNPNSAKSSGSQNNNSDHLEDIQQTF